MAFADPQSVTIGASAKTLARTGSGLDTGAFSEDTGETKLLVSHSYNKRTRRTLRIDHQKLAADVMDSSLNVPYSMSCYIVVDVPTTGYTVAEQKQNVDGFIAWLSASSGAAITKLLGGEN